ncbi:MULTISPECIES: DUF2332 domain-containing protein [Mammaliicoccus]|uniref:DUF2332 domain-containing protein n=1 Tax=Mammaliicoccus TaxID=2803850 RepID=UPI00188383BE|nr:DUF2332 domain-containing protein [Mammaliicoccus lentus]MBF0841925.1 DUF2332 domain-containing protein [Mammaliicoccus lentus]
MINEKFIQFADVECKNSSEIYRKLSYYIAQDKDLIEICNYAPINQPIPNLFLGSVNYLLLKGYDNNLYDEYYVNETSDLIRKFKEFCIKNKIEIIKIMNNKLVQTNEVRRSSYIFPILCYINDKRKINLLEIGCSAGLQLLADKYRYKYDVYPGYKGNLTSDLTISSAITKGEFGSYIDEQMDIGKRIGIDLNTIDFTKDEEFLWLKALIWPEHNDRRILLEKARDTVINESLKLKEGNALEILIEEVKKIPTDENLLIFHTHVANQMSIKEKEYLVKTIENIGKNRNLYHLYNNINDKLLHLDSYKSGEKHPKIVGQTDGHGKWFEWNL